ncbi:MAG: sarcinarray family MAST domain-containing protein [Candidatus Methanoperedens sp.]
MNFQPTTGAENEYGIVRAWFNGENATVNNVQLKIGEPFEVKVELLSKINGDISFKLYEPGVTRAFKVINGPSEIEKRIDIMNIESGWSKTYTWTVESNEDWKGGKAPLNVIVQFNKGMNNKQIDFTIANPYILDEQYTGAVTTTTPAPEIIGTGALPAKSTPFLPFIFTVSTLLLAWRLKKIVR